MAMNEKMAKDISKAFAFIMILAFISKIPDAFEVLTREKGTEENVKEFELNAKNCKLAKWENIEKNMSQFEISQFKPEFKILGRENFSLESDKNIYFENGFFYKKNFYLSDDFDNKKQFMEKIGFDKLCMTDIDQNNRSTSYLQRVEDMKLEYDKPIKEEIKVSDVKDTFFTNIEKVEKALNNDEFLLKTFKNKLSNLDFNDDKSVEELLTLVKVLKKDK